MSHTLCRPRRPRAHDSSGRFPGRRSARGAAVALLLAVAACGGADEEPSPRLEGAVSVGAKTDQPGFNLHSEHTYRGFESSLAADLGKRAGFEPKFRDVVSSKREEELKDGSSDLVIATYSITPEREDEVDFVGPYFQTRQGLLVREDDDRIKNENDVKGKSVCTVEGSTSEDVKVPTDRVETQTDYSDCVQRLRDERVDAVFTDEALLYGYVQRYEKSDKPVEVVPKTSFGGWNRYGIGIKEGRKGDCEELREALRDYLDEEWEDDVESQLRALTEAYPDWQNRFRPDADDVDTYSSCKK